jgi:hypothetical protein
MSIHIFSFGSDHTLPDGEPASGKVVAVDAPDGTDHRAVFMAWLGSNRFSSEYTEAEYMNTRMTSKVAYCITVEAACQQCEFPESACKCIPQIDWWETGETT